MRDRESLGSVDAGLLLLLCERLLVDLGVAKQLSRGESAAAG